MIRFCPNKALAKPVAAVNNKAVLGALAVCLAIIAVAGLLAERAETHRDQHPSVPLGLVTSLPIYWGQADGFGAAFADAVAQHWVRERLERAGYVLEPLDVLATEGSTAPAEGLVRLSTLLIAQPRPFAPADFVALDGWVRDGGHALVFADPLLTEHSDLPMGDPRRPQYAALLSPILKRWGVEQVFDESQPEGIRQIDFAAFTIPVDQAGTFRLVGEGDAQCRIAADGLVAQCSIGKGAVLLVGDAALLDQERGIGSSAEALLGLLQEVQSQ